VFGEEYSVAQATKKTEFYLRKDVSLLLKIAEIPDILNLNEDLFAKSTWMKRLGAFFKVNCACLSRDRFSDYGELHC